MSTRLVWVFVCDDCGELSPYEEGFSALVASLLRAGWLVESTQSTRRRDRCPNCYRSRAKAIKPHRAKGAAR